MAGFNMSADLQRPEHNIPVGTLAAVFTSYITCDSHSDILKHRPPLYPLTAACAQSEYTIHLVLLYHTAIKCEVFVCV